jgi:hypothetical protein
MFKRKNFDFFGTFLKAVTGGDNVGTISIGGRSFQGNDLDIVGGRIYVDGKDVTDDANYQGGDVKVEITGDVGSVKSDRSVSVRGSIHGDVEAGGSVNCSAVSGKVEAGGSVNCNSVGGNVKAGGSVNCGDVQGDVKASMVKADTIHGRKL